MRELLESADCVLFDFDGPMCRLYVRHSAPAVAARLRTLLDARGASAEPENDPYAVLRAAARDAAAGRLEQHALVDVVKALTAEELLATDTAWPTPYADQLVQTLHATGKRLALTSDHAEPAITRYLRTRGLAHLFAGHIHGRDAAATRLMSDADCVRRALESTETPAERALFIGDSPRALATADAAGVRFLGYARDEPSGAVLREAGAERLVTSLLEVVDAAAVPHFR